MCRLNFKNSRRITEPLLTAFFFLSTSLLSFHLSAFCFSRSSNLISNINNSVECKPHNINKECSNNALSVTTMVTAPHSNISSISSSISNNVMNKTTYMKGNYNYVSSAAAGTQSAVNGVWCLLCSSICYSYAEQVS